jgi:WD40 repeat protein
MGEGPTLQDHNRSIRAISFSPDGRLLAAACNDRPTRIWDVATGKQTEVELPAANRLLFSPDGTLAVLIYPNGKAQLWDASARKNAWTLKTDVDGITPLAFTADGGKLLHLGPGRSVALTDVGSLGKSPPPYWQLPGKGGIDGVALAPDMRHLALVDSGSINVKIVRLDR